MATADGLLARGKDVVEEVFRSAGLYRGLVGSFFSWQLVLPIAKTPTLTAWLRHAADFTHSLDLKSCLCRHQKY